MKRPPPKYARWIGTEDDFQKSVARLMDSKTRHWFHVANERKTTNHAGAKLKANGVKAGIPDVICLDRIGGYNGLAIELKVYPNTAQPTQKEWHDKLRGLGWMVVVSNSRDEVGEIVEAYFSPNQTSSNATSYDKALKESTNHNGH